jgi:hypothetical protein
VSISRGREPERLLRQGRPIDPDFSLEERLYRRCPDTEVLQGEPFTDQIAFYPAMSVNRSKYSLVHDVLYPDYFAKYGVLSFAAGGIPEPFQPDGGALYEWKPSHEPLEENYAHSEVRTYRDGVFDPKLRIQSTLVKKYFRERLREVARIEILPGEGVTE